jgi:hypothetical protein
MCQPQQKQAILIAIAAVVVIVAFGAVLVLAFSGQLGFTGQSQSGMASLSPEAKEEYILLVAYAYSRDHNLEAAQARLVRLGAPNVNLWITDMIDRYIREGGDPADVQALAELAYGLGVTNAQVLAYAASPTPRPTNTPVPTLTLVPTHTPSTTPTNTPQPPTMTPTPVPPSATPTLQPTDTRPPPSITPSPSATPTPAPTNTVPPQPTSTPQPTATPSQTATPEPPATKWTWTPRLIGPGQEGQTCSDGLKLVRVTVLDVGGNQIPGIWIREQYTGLYQVSGHKGDDPFWGPGEAEFSGLDGAQLCVATAEGGKCESDLTRDLPLHDPPPLDDLWEAGYCQCCEPDITKERCQALFDAGKCLGISHYAWRVEFRRSH